MKPTNYKEEENREDRQRICLELELISYEADGVDLFLDGHKSNSYYITQACMVAETGTYMRDYVEDEFGRVRQIYFDKVQNR